MSAAPAPVAPIAPPKTRLGTCFDFVLLWEAGFANDPRDPGGATNMGITRATLADWRGREVSVEEVRALAAEEARAILGARYWNPVRASDLPVGLDLLAFDMAVNSGPGASAKILQRLVGVEADGMIGPWTIGAVRAVHPSNLRTLFGAFCDERMTYLRGREGWPTFGAGWTRRVEDARATALALLPAAAPAVAAALSAGLTARDTERLRGVHPDLVRVVLRAAKVGARFYVVEGLRTIERQRQLVASGASKTLNSRHLTGHAVDLYPLGWTQATPRSAFIPVVEAIRASAAFEGVAMVHGWDWHWDAPHHELAWAAYVM